MKRVAILRECTRCGICGTAVLEAERPSYRTPQSLVIPFSTVVMSAKMAHWNTPRLIQ
jgi:hypothetical protein